MPTADPRLYPFAGVRVLDLSWVIAGPMTSQYLAIHGADVIRVESRLRPDTLRSSVPMVGGEKHPDASAYWAGYNQGKRGITLNLRDPRARALALQLVAVCDVVTENFAPGALDRLGLNYDALRAVRPDLIMLSLSLAGQTGPERHYKGFGTVIQAGSGITHLTGWPDRPPVGTGVAYTDFIAANIGAMALLAALRHRARTGVGQHIDLSQQEAGLYALDATLLDAAVNGANPVAAGNRHPSAAPHAVFPCDGDDSWVALAVFSDQQWLALRAVLGEPAWAQEERFATLLGRKAHEDELETLIGRWTATLTAERAAALLRAVGVPAAEVASSRELHADPQLEHRDHFLDLNHPMQGGFPFDAQSYRLDGQRPLPPRSAPALGQHTTDVLLDLLGADAGDYAAWEAEGALR